MAHPRTLGSKARNLAELNIWTKQRREAALEPDLPIVDPHHHVWEDQRGRYLIHELVEDIGASGHNIVATVYVQTGSNMFRADGPAALRPAGEVEFVNGIAAMSASGCYGKARLCAGIVGHADLALGDRVQPALEALLAAGNGRLRGVRHGVTWSPDSGEVPRSPPHLMLDPIFRQGLTHLEPLGLSFDAWLFYSQLPDLVDLLRAFSNTNVVLNHVGGLLGHPSQAGKRDEIFKMWSGYIRELARFPNLTVKVGGLGMLRCGWDFHLRDVPPASEELAAAWRPYVETCIEAFGPDRCMMESNFPVDKQSCGYGVLWNALKRITRGCSHADKLALYQDTAARVYRVKV